MDFPRTQNEKEKSLGCDVCTFFEVGEIGFTYCVNAGNIDVYSWKQTCKNSNE